MGYLSRDRKKRLRDFRRIYGNGDTQIGLWCIERIHQIPSPFTQGQPVDYWVNTGSDVILLTIESAAEEKLRFIKMEPRKCLHVTVFSQVDDLNDETFAVLVQRLLKIGFPNGGVVRATRQF